MTAREKLYLLAKIVIPSALVIILDSSGVRCLSSPNPGQIWLAHSLISLSLVLLALFWIIRFSLSAEKFRRYKGNYVLGGAVLLAVCGQIFSNFLFCMVVSWDAYPHPQNHWTDKELIDLFHDHKAQFTALREMAAADMPKTAFLSSDRDNDTLTRDEDRKYKDVMHLIGHSFVMTMHYDTTTRFVFEGGGMWADGPGKLKGIEYIPGNPEREGKVEPALDGPSKLPPGVYLRPLEPHWFLVYEWVGL